MQLDDLILDLHLPMVGAVTSGSRSHRRLRCDHPLCVRFYSPEQVGEGIGQKVFPMLCNPIPPPHLLSAVAEAVAVHEGRDT